MKDFFKRNIISALKAHRLLRKGCVGYLASMIEEEKQKKIIDKVLVVCNYLEVFREELPELPLGREILFRIKLIPRT